MRSRGRWRPIRNGLTIPWPISENVSGRLPKPTCRQGTVAKLDWCDRRIDRYHGGGQFYGNSIGLLMNDRALYDSLAGRAKTSSLLEDASEQSETLRAFLPVRGGREQIAPPAGAVELRRSLFLSGRGCGGSVHRVCGEALHCGSVVVRAAVDRR